MIGLIVTALLQTLDALDHEDDSGYALHCGEAGGIAAATAAFGVRALELCDDISDAYEDIDLDFMRYILRETSERPGRDEADHARTRQTNSHALEFGAALQEAVKAKGEGDHSRHSLMIGFTTGLMFRYQGPDGGVQGTVLDKIMEGYHTDSDALLRQAHGTLGFGARMSDPMSFMGKDEAARYYEERVRIMRWVQNFGLRDACSTDEAVAIPNALSINYQLIQQAGEADETQIGNEVEYEEIEFLNEEDLMPVDDCEDTGEEEGTREAAAYVRSGTDKAEQGDYDGAIADYDRAIAIAPDAVGPYVNRAISRDNVGDYEGAIADWTRALELNPGDAGWYVNRGMVREAIGDYDGALADYSRSTSLSQITRWPTLLAPTSGANRAIMKWRLSTMTALWSSGQTVRQATATAASPSYRSAITRVRSLISTVPLNWNPITRRPTPTGAWRRAERRIMTERSPTITAP